MFTRMRTKGALDVVPNGWHNYMHSINCSDSTSFHAQTPGIDDTAIGTDSYVRVGDKTTMADVVTSGFRKKIAAGAVIFNPMAKERKVTIVSGDSVFYVTALTKSCNSPIRYSHHMYTGGLLRYNVGRRCPLPLHMHVHDGSAVKALEDEVWARCLANRGADSDAANFFESLAESDQAWRMLHSPLQNVRDFNDMFSRRWGTHDAVRNVFNFASSEWLRYRYGIRPLMSDAAAVMRALRRSISEKSKKRKRYTARASKTRTFTRVLTNASTVNFGTFNVIGSYTTTVTVRAMFLDEYARDMWDDLGFTFRNLVGLPYELTKLSFVLDWFVNMGDVIYANIPRADLKAHGGCYTTEKNTFAIFSDGGITAVPATWSVQGSPSDMVTTHYVTKQRYPNNDASGAKLLIKSDFRLDNFNRGADLLAIVIQQLGRFRFENPDAFLGRRNPLSR